MMLGLGACGEDDNIKGIKKYRVEVEVSGDGIVLGGGIFDLNNTCTLVATAEMDANFVGYFNDKGEMISANKDFSFNVLRDYLIFAKFELKENP